MFRSLGRWLLRAFQRFIGFEKVRKVAIAKEVLDDLCEMAAQAHPNEMLAFIASTKGVQDGLLLIDEIQLQPYQASEYSTSFNLWNLPTFTSTVGTVHSHPGPSRRPSEADLQLFGQYGLVHGILGYPYTRRSITFYDKQGDAIDVRMR